MENVELSWEIPEYADKKRSVDWYWTIGLVTLVIIIGAVYWHDTLFGLLILLGIGSLTYLTVRKPEMVTIAITKRGIMARNEFFTFKSIKGFWVETEPQVNGDQHLLIMTARTYNPIIALPINGIAPEKIRQLLLPHLQEEEMRESVAHKFMEMFGF